MAAAFRARSYAEAAETLRSMIPAIRRLFTEHWSEMGFARPASGITRWAPDGVGRREPRVLRRAATDDVTHDSGSRQGHRVSKLGQEFGEESFVPSGLLELSAQGAL